MGRAGLRIAILCVLALAALLAPAGTAGAAAKKPRPDLTPRPAEFPGVAVEQDVRIPMPDGVTLVADVRRPATADGTPAPGRFPALLTMTPYNKGALANAGGGLEGLSGKSDLMVQRGYVQVVVDVRGTGGSEGAWDSFGEAEQRDSVEIVRWIRRQPWSDGKLGTYGASYMGINQLFLAARRPKGLKAAFPIIPAEDVYRDVVWHGGAIDAGFIPLWLGLVTALKMVPPTDVARDPGRALKVYAERILEGLQFPVGTAVDGVAGGEKAFDGPFYRLRSPGRVASRIRIPTFITGGWYDIFQRGEPRLYNKLTRLRPGRKQLLMGPWYHITAGDGLGAKGTPPPLEHIALAWFDRWIKGRRNGVERFGPVHLFSLGRERWSRVRTFPRRDVRYERRYLGATTLDAKPGARGTDTFLGNQVNGLCNRGTTQWTAGIVPPGQPCETDNRLPESLGVTYTSPAQERDLHLSGPIGVHLRGATTAKDTTWIATFSDVHPDGKSEQITAGWLIHSRRAVDRRRSTRAPNGDLVAPFHPFTRAALKDVQPGRTDTLEIEVFATDAVIRRGHRLRLTLTSGDVPHLLQPVPSLVNSAGAVNTVRRGESWVTLPVVGR